MKFALFLGCNIPARLNQYESSARAVLGKVNVDLVDIKDFNCCGYPVRNIDHDAFIISSARNLALAAKEGLNILSLCKCCYGSLKKADHLLKEDSTSRDKINEILGREGLQYEGGIEIKHFLSVLYHDVGIEAVKEKVERSFKDLRIAVHYGCHALRPSKIVQFDDPVAPVIFDRLIEVTGAKSIHWSSKLECCGAPLLGINDALSMDLTERKLLNGKQSGATHLCTACPYCQMQFDSVQKMILRTRGASHNIPSVLFSQLLGLSMDIERQLLGLEMNQYKIDDLYNFLS
ncbi:MAG: CoB--CoM heterodisulfide reductase iron-sulfur subunit B family protein [Thermodesulfobacteriota bacterium]|nr:CoB--CoM heterodisulfide reductase iron-sulfur subunit B family protein [Thermodesulfobacteriota bacterium]